MSFFFVHIVSSHTQRSATLAALFVDGLRSMRHWIATLLQASSALHTRRAVATHGAAFTLLGTRAFATPALAAKRPACGDIETCRAEGERKEAELEAALELLCPYWSGEAESWEIT